MKSLSFFKTATLFLLVLNLVLIFFLFQGRPKGPHGHKGPKSAFKQEAIAILELDNAQTDEFIALTKIHREAIEELNAESGTILKPYFHGVFKEVNPLQEDSLMIRFQAIEKEKVEVTRDHFLDVEKMLKPEQKQNFDLFLKSAVGILLLDEKKPKKSR